MGFAAVSLPPQLDPVVKAEREAGWGRLAAGGRRREPARRGAEARRGEAGREGPEARMDLREPREPDALTSCRPSSGGAEIQGLGWRVQGVPGDPSAAPPSCRRRSCQPRGPGVGLCNCGGSGSPSPWRGQVPLLRGFASLLQQFIVKFLQVPFRQGKVKEQEFRGPGCGVKAKQHPRFPPRVGSNQEFQRSTRGGFCLTEEDLSIEPGGSVET